MAVVDQLAGRSARVPKAKVKHHVVQTGFQNLQHRLAGDAAAAQRLFINTAKLLLHQTVVITQLLLLVQAFAVFGGLATRLRPVDAGTVVAAFEIFRRTENRNSETAADADAGTCVTSHDS